MSIQDWKMENDLCRCCHSEGTFVNLAEPCMRLEKEEIYSEMLQQCLDLNIIPIPGPLCASTYTICPNCILRLRDAFHFKEQVKKCELKFKELYNKDAIKLSSFIEVKLEQDVPNEEPEFITLKQDDAFDTDYDDDGQNVSETEQKPKEESPETARPKRAKTKTQPKAKAVKTRKVKSVQDKAKQVIKLEAKESAREDNGILKSLLLSIPSKSQNAIEGPEITNADYEEKMVNGKKKYYCNRCSILLSSFDSIKKHIITIHLKYFSAQCPMCDEKFGRNSSLKSHMAYRHSVTAHKVDGVTILESVEKLHCPNCKKEFSCLRQLRCHIRHMHLTQKCPDCSLDFRLKELPYHRHEVHGASIPTCGVCGYINRSQNRIDWHQRKVHIKEKNIECTHCGEKFFDKEGLKKHEVRHDPVKKFECSYCNKKFPRRNAMKAHEKIHTGEKNKVCRICDERFVQKASLNYHMTKHHPDAT